MEFHEKLMMKLTGNDHFRWTNGGGGGNNTLPIWDVCSGIFLSIY